VPLHEVVGQQGIVRLVLVSSRIAEQDEALWQIADYLRRDTPGQAVQVMFWTDKASAATGLPLTDRAVETQVAQVNINPASNHRELRRLKRS
jgi:hypothetical protein